MLRIIAIPNEELIEMHDEALNELENAELNLKNSTSNIELKRNERIFNFKAITFAAIQEMLFEKGLFGFDDVGEGSIEEYE